MTTISTCLLFDAEAGEAARFHVGLVPGSTPDRVSRPASARAALPVEIRLAGAGWPALNWSQPVPRGPGFRSCCGPRIRPNATGSGPGTWPMAGPNGWAAG